MKIDTRVYYTPDLTDNIPLPYGFIKDPQKRARGFSVEEIRHIREKKMLQREYAEIYGVDRTTIGDIQRKDTYKDVD